MLSRFSRKQKILVGGSIIAALIINHYVTTSREVGSLVHRLEMGDSSLKITAAQELARLGSSADDAIDALSTAIRDHDPDVRLAATQALLQIDRDVAVDSLIEAFEDRNTGVRMDAAENLERIGTARALAAVKRAQVHSQEVYERARLDEWADPIRREFDRKRRKEFRRHKRIYGN